MNNIKRNVVFVGFNKREQKMFLEDFSKWDKFPKFIFLDTLEEALKHQGFMLIIKDEEFNYSFREYDINNRHMFRKYIMVKILTHNKRYSDSYSKISIEPNDFKYSYNAEYFILLYKRYLEKNLNKKTTKRLENIERVHNYLKKKRFITTKKIMLDLNVSDKWVKRYMQDVNDKYQNIGFDRYNKIWYVVKNK